MRHSTLKILGATAIALLAPFVPLDVLSIQSFSTLAQTDPAARLAEADRLYQEGTEKIEARQFQEAIRLFEQALRIYQELDEDEEAVEALLNLGSSYQQINEYDRAVNYFHQALDITQESDRLERRYIYSSLKIIADLLYAQAVEEMENDRFQTAIRHLQRALEIYQEIDGQIGIAVQAIIQNSEARVLFSIGAAHAFLGDHEQAIDLYEEALEIFQEVENPGGQTDTLLNLGESHFHLGQYNQMISRYNEALTIAQESNDLFTEAASLLGLGSANYSLGQSEQAVIQYEQALEIFRSAGSLAENRLRFQEGEIRCLIGLSDVYRDSRQYQKAIDTYKQVLIVAQEIGDQRSEADAIFGMGIIYSVLGQRWDAIDSLENALQIYQTRRDLFMQASVLNSLATVYDISVPRDNNQPLVLHLEGDDETAISYYSQALAIFREGNNRESEGIVLANIGRLLAQQEKTELAIVFLKRSVDVREEIRGNIRELDRELQLSYTDTIADDYRKLADLLLQQNRIPEAQRVLDLLKVQELDEYLRDVQRSGSTEGGIGLWQIETELLALYQQVLDDVAEFQQLSAQPFESLSPQQQQRLAELRDRRGEVQEQFVAFLDRPEVTDAVEQIRKSTQGQNLELESYAQLQDNLQSLPQKTVLLYPLILEDRLELVLVPADAPPLRFPVPVSAVELNQTIVDFGQALKSSDSNIEPIAQQLYTWLVAPMEEKLTGVESIIYAPDGALRYIPLAALHDGQQYLAQRFSISHITAASLTDFDTPPQRETRRLLAAACAQCSFVFDIAQQQFRFRDLPFTETEVNLLATQVPGSDMLLNQEFSPTALVNRLGSYSLIHLATHAAFVDDAPHESFIVFGNGEKVALQDIRYRWELNNAELIVLSACETAVGSAELGNGVEILGLGYQIQEAGAQAVIASLWQVSDGGTQVLMNAFYDALNQGMSKAEALRQAQIDLITKDESATGVQRGFEFEWLEGASPEEISDRLSHPYYWAPFILIGNGL